MCTTILRLLSKLKETFLEQTKQYLCTFEIILFMKNAKNLPTPNGLYLNNFESTSLKKVISMWNDILNNN
ncbi:hypothetical protein BpHYR1_029410 [Brachionus plicatilis]|uniref:Uncharacterized protein n=1 Tax=Brachionus plicatilis TaxID=10195 RepID=A0A3M7R236_BRAPC|nr:hypothetical protein BpHYR1_029410 [Brachionus plicatilis]